MFRSVLNESQEQLHVSPYLLLPLIQIARQQADTSTKNLEQHSAKESNIAYMYMYSNKHGHRLESGLKEN